MTAFFQTIASILSSAAMFIVNLFSMLLMMITTIPKALAYVIGAVGYMPPFVGSVILTSISIAAVIVIINHWG